MDVFNLKSFVLFLSVFGCCAGQDLLPHDGPLDGVVGKNVTIKPDLEPGETFLTMAWTFNGGDELVPIVTLVSGGGGVENIAEDYKGRVFINKTNGILTLGPLKTTDNGDYAVQMVNKKGETQTGETKLQVLVPVSDVAIKSSVTEAVELNSTVVLTCSAKGSFITFAWNNGTTPIVADGKKLTLTTVPLGSSSTLTVKDPLRTDLVGPIYCSATNKLGSEKSAPFNLSVSYGPEMVVLAATPAIPASMVLRMDGKLALSCTTQSSPPATVAWHHNGAALAKETAASLVLEKLTEAHSGNYSCVANNAKTLRSVSSKVIQFTVMQAVSGTTLTGPTETLLAGKQTANLSCQATAGKATTQAWFKDGKPLSPGDRVSVLADKVSIKPVQKGDNGEYRCELTNAVNTDSATYKMVVNYGPEAAAVEAEEAVEINDVVKLTCAAMSMPAATYTWKFNGTKTAVTTAEYLIEKAVYKNTGMYTCEAHNAVTGLSVSAMHKLSVKEEGALDEGLSDGAIAGIVIAVLIVLAAAIAGAVYFQRQRTRPYEAASQAP